MTPSAAAGGTTGARTEVDVVASDVSLPLVGDWARTCDGTDDSGGGGGGGCMLVVVELGRPPFATAVTGDLATGDPLPMSKPKSCLALPPGGLDGLGSLPLSAAP